MSAPLQALDSVEYAILAAVADRIVRVEPSVPTPSGLDVALRADGVLALADRGVQKDFRRLLRLFDNGLMGMATLTAVSPFTACSPAAQDSRLAAWEHSRMPLFRTGYQAMKRLCAACYYAAPEAWPSIGYPGPPDVL